MPAPPREQGSRSDTSAPSSRSAPKRLYFTAAALVGIVLAIELVSWLMWFALSRQPFSYSQVVAAQERATQGPFAAESTEGKGEKKKGRKRSGVLGPVSLHPYLGFVYDPGKQERGFRKRHGYGINDYGFIDDGNPIHQRSPDRLIVAIVGGSVAYYVSVFAEEALRSALQDVAEGREIVLVRMALGGWKQPQQLLAVSWMLSLGAEFDVVINIDGFNEIALPWPENAAQGVFPGYPRIWMIHTRGMPSNEEKRLLADALLASKNRERWAQLFLDSPARYSVVAQTAWKIRDATLISEMATAFRALQEWKPDRPSYSATGPGVPEGATQQEMYPEFAANWGRASIQLSRLCEANGIRYLHFLQANQYVEGSKPMSEAERRDVINPEHAYRPGVVAGYAHLIDEGRRIREAGVDFHDLTMIFAGEGAPMYLDDCCHYNEAGNRRVMNRVAQTLARSIETNGL